MVQKAVNFASTVDGQRVVVKDQNGIPSMGILIRNRSLFPVRISALGFKVGKMVIPLKSYYLPLRLKKNPEPNSNRPNIPDDSDPAELRSGESVRIDLTGQKDKSAINEAIKITCQKHRMTPEALVLSRRVAALVALESGREFTSMPLWKFIRRSISEPVRSLIRRFKRTPASISTVQT